MSDDCCGGITLFKGEDGRTIYNGTGAPTLTTANEGDFYIDTTAWEIYGPFTTSGWGTGTSIVGPSGNGNGIASITWTSNSGGQPQGTAGTTDTYTITFDNASTTTYVVGNGDINFELMSSSIAYSTGMGNGLAVDTYDLFSQIIDKTKELITPGDEIEVLAHMKYFNGDPVTVRFEISNTDGIDIAVGDPDDATYLWKIVITNINSNSQHWLVEQQKITSPGGLYTTSFQVFTTNLIAPISYFKIEATTVAAGANQVLLDKVSIVKRNK